MRQDFIFAYIKRIFVFFRDLIGVLAGLVEEVCQIYLVSACLVFAKANGTDQGFVVVVGIKECAMYAAKVNEVERGAPHDAHRFKFIALGRVGIVGNATAVLIHGKLADAAQFSIDRCAVGKKLMLEGDAATGTKRLLLLFALNR